MSRQLCRVSVWAVSKDQGWAMARMPPRGTVAPLGRISRCQGDQPWALKLGRSWLATMKAATVTGPSYRSAGRTNSWAVPLGSWLKQDFP